jgi:hypothetical protein
VVLNYGSRISVLVSFFRNKDDDAGQNKTVKPTATMALYSNGISVDGATVKLTDVITMVMQLDAEFIRMFIHIYL